MAHGKHTPGPVKANFETAFIRDAYGGVVAVIYGDRGHSGIDETSHARIRLITDAFDVLDQTGLTPRQLAEQRAELLASESANLAVIENLLTYLSKHEARLPPFSTSSLELRIEKTRAAIAKATTGGAS